MESLKEKTAKGLFWGGLSNGIQQLLNLVFGIFLGRLLSPSEYGMVGMLTIFSLIAGSIQESGFIAAIVNKKEVKHEDYNAVFWFSCLTSIVIYSILFAAAPLIADFFHTPELTALARYSFISFVIASFSTAHYAYLFRNLMVKQRTIATFFAMVISGISGVTMAFCGFSYWGIVTQNIIYICITTAFAWHFAKFMPSFRIDFSPLKKMIGFSCKILLTNIFNHINNNISTVILGKFYSDKEVGNYTQANKWDTMGHSFITGMMNQVAQPVLASVEGDNERQARVFRKMLRFAAFVACPAMLGLSIIAPELIEITIGSAWAESAKMMQILCIGGVFIPITTLYSNLIVAKGKSDIFLYNTIAISVTQLSIALITYPMGLKVMLYAFICVNIAWIFVWHHFVNREIGLPLMGTIGDISRFFALAAIAMTAAYYSGIAIGNIYIMLGVKIIVGASAYAALLWIFRIPELNEGIEFAMQKIRKK